MDYLEYRRKLKLAGKPPKEKKVYKIPRESKKRAKINREYSKASRPFWRGKPCRMKLKGCTGIAQGIHHPQGKVTMELLMDPNNWVECCNSCNQRAESHPWEAGEFKKSRIINVSPSRSLEDRAEDLPF